MLSQYGSSEAPSPRPAARSKPASFFEGESDRTSPLAMARLSPISPNSPSASSGGGPPVRLPT